MLKPIGIVFAILRIQKYHGEGDECLLHPSQIRRRLFPLVFLHLNIIFSIDFANGLLFSSYVYFNYPYSIILQFAHFLIHAKIRIANC